MSSSLPAAPNVGLIVKWNGSAWADETGNTKWNSVIPYTLSDTDIAVIDAHGLNRTRQAYWWPIALNRMFTAAKQVATAA